MLILIALVLMPTMAACTPSAPTGANGSIKISYYKGGTGAAWIEEIAKRFT